jgi:hypothetical protein
MGKGLEISISNSAVGLIPTYVASSVISTQQLVDLNEDMYKKRWICSTEYSNSCIVNESMCINALAIAKCYHLLISNCWEAGHYASHSEVGVQHKLRERENPLRTWRNSSIILPSCPD